MSQFPCVPWDRYDEAVRLLGRREELPSALAPSVPFLETLGFVEAARGCPHLSDKGDAYFHSRHVIGEANDAARMVKESLLNLPTTRQLCQVFGGRGAVTRGQVENLLYRHQVMPPDQPPSALGTYLDLLNRFGVVSYSKKHGTVRILEAGTELDRQSLPRQVFLEPETPYSNVRRVRELLSACEGEVYWVDKHFDRKGLMLIADALDCTTVPAFTIVSSGANVDKSAEADLGLLRAELAAKGTTLRWIVVDHSQMRDVHDRWVVCDRWAYNLPPVNSIFGAQAAEIIASDAPDKIRQIVRRLVVRGQELR